MRVGNSKRKIVGVEIRNTKKGLSQTVQFQLEGSLLKEPEQVGLRRALAWTPGVLKAAGEWNVLLSQQTLKEESLSQANPPLESFFFDVPTELRYLWFHLLGFHGDGGGLRYFAPILQSGDLQTTYIEIKTDWNGILFLKQLHYITSIFVQFPPQMCAPGPTGQAVTGSATSKIQAIRRGAFTRRRTDIPKICLIFAMEKRRLGAMKTAQVEKNFKCKG